MTPARFAQLRDRIAARYGRSNEWRKRALKRLVAEAGAAEQLTQGRVLSYRLPSGKYVCVKHRYATEDQAAGAVRQIGMEQDGRTKPTRAYPCYFCNGWHITSEQRG